MLEFDLKEIIKNKGFTLGYVSKCLNLSRMGFSNKLNGKTEFYANEIIVLSELLNLSVEEREKIFFTQKVDKKETLS